MPGPLQPLESDARIPILLIHSGVIGTPVNGWEIILPLEWVLPLWNGLVYAGGKAIGYQDMHAFRMDSGIATLPYDFTETKAHEQYAADKKKELAEKYSRRPKNKRVNYEKLGIDNPFDSGLGQIDVLHSQRAVRLLDQSTNLKQFVDKFNEIRGTTLCTSVVEKLHKRVLLIAKQGVIRWNGRVYCNTIQVGVVTSAQYSFSRGTCIGIATVKIQAEGGFTVRNINGVKEIQCSFINIM